MKKMVTEQVCHLCEPLKMSLQVNEHFYVFQKNLLLDVL